MSSAKNSPRHDSFCACFCVVVVVLSSLFAALVVAAVIVNVVDLLVAVAVLKIEMLSLFSCCCLLVFVPVHDHYHCYNFHSFAH